MQSSLRHSALLPALLVTLLFVRLLDLTGCASAPPPRAAVRSAPIARAPAPVVMAAERPGILGRDWIFVKVIGYDGPLPSPPPVAGFIMTREGQRLTGTTACNRLGAGFELNESAETLRFTSIRNTRMLCDRVASDTEEAVLDAMIATDGYRLDGNTLELLSKGSFIARLTTTAP